MFQKMVLPLCRCRVLYIGSAVPTVTKDGLQGIQQPLRERYPVEDTPETRGIDSWLSVWSNGILLEYIEGDKKSESAFFPINTLHYCASVRYVNVTGYAVEGGGERFLPLDSPFADIPDSPHPPIFAAILRRTTGVKVLECHGFICSNAKAANALVRCCFHAYADCMYLKLDEKIPNLKAIKEGSTGERSPASPNSDEDISVEADDHTDRRMHGWERRQQEGEYDSVSISSSLLRNNKAASENGARHHALVPFESSPRRAGSDADLTASFRGDPRMMPPFMPPPPHHRMPPPGMFPPPPFMRPPPHFAGGPGGPHMPPPHFFPPPPPHMMRGGPPHPMFWGPPPPPRGFFHPPPFGGMPPFRPPSPGEGPIITGPESVYGTMRRSAYEEPAYVASGGPPESSYQPSSYPPEQYEAYYDTLKKGKGSKKGSVTSKDVWEQYEAGIYRKPHINEKAFSNTLRETAEKDTMNTTLRRKDETSTQTATADVLRPDTPPADYEVRNGGAVRAH